MHDDRQSIQDRDLETARLERQMERSWLLLAGMTLVSTLGLAISLAPILKMQLASVWPWGNTHIVLLTGLILCIGLLVWHLTSQRRKLAQVQEHMLNIRRTARSVERKQNARLHALMNVSRMMGAVTDTESMFEGITNTCLEIFQCQKATLMMVDTASHELEVRAASGLLQANRVITTRQKIGEGVAGWVAEHQESLMLQSDTDMSKYPELELGSDHVNAAMVAPILVRDELVGVLCISSTDQDMLYTHDDLRALEIFAENAGTCIRNTERAEWMRQMLERQTNTPQGSGV